MKFNFEIKKNGPGKARAGIIHTKNGDILTPAFIPVGTKATVKALTPEEIKGTGAQAILANTYHLYLSPGADIISRALGFAKFMNWSGPTFTDSGGFQVFSLGLAYGEKVSKVTKGEIPEDFEEKNEHTKLVKIDEEGVTFNSHIDGSVHRFTPESSMEIQWKLGADIIFAFDECTSPTAPYEYQKNAWKRTYSWAKKSVEAHERLDPQNIQALFGVVQGGKFEDLRRESAQELAKMNFDGFGIGGSFNKNDISTAVGWVTDELPNNKPRHLLGIGEPEDMILAIAEGIDTFDCVTPTRNARNGTIYTNTGKVHMKNEKYKDDFSPVTEDCDCYTCKNFSKAYLSHLYRQDEMLAGTLGSIHNVHFLIKVANDAREAILQDKFEKYSIDFLNKYKK